MAKMNMPNMEKMQGGPFAPDLLTGLCLHRYCTAFRLVTELEKEGNPWVGLLHPCSTSTVRCAIDSCTQNL